MRGLDAKSHDPKSKVAEPGTSAPVPGGALAVSVAGLRRTTSHSVSALRAGGQPSPSLRASLILIAAAPSVPNGLATNLMNAAGTAASTKETSAPPKAIGVAVGAAKAHHRLSVAFTSLRLVPSLTKQYYLLLERAIYYANSISYWAEYQSQITNLAAKTAVTAINESLPEIYLEDVNKFDTANISETIPTGIYQLLQIFKEKRDDNLDEKEMLSLFGALKMEAAQQCQKRKAELAIKRGFPFCCCTIENNDDLVIKFLDLIANIKVRSQDINATILDELYKKIKNINVGLVSHAAFYTQGFGQLQPIPQSPSLSDLK